MPKALERYEKSYKARKYTSTTHYYQPYSEKYPETDPPPKVTVLIFSAECRAQSSVLAQRVEEN